EIIEPMSERILGRVALDDVEDPFTHEVIVESNEEIDEAKVRAIEEAGIERVKIRSVLTCQAPRGICVECYGRDLARGRKVNVGERERYTVVYGAKLNVRDGQKIEAGTQLAEWDPFAQPIVAEVPGTVRFNDIIEGVTMNEQLDEVTGLSRKSIIESRDADSQPRLVIEDDKGNPKMLPGNDQPARYNLPVGANITVNDGDLVDAGEVIARIPRETTKTKDITGGLPRVAELFEARKPKEHADISEIESVVSFGKDTKGKRKVV